MAKGSSSQGTLVGILAIVAGVLILIGFLPLYLVVGIFLIIWGILSLAGKEVTCYGFFYARWRVILGDNSTILRHYCNDFPQNTALCTGYLSYCIGLISCPRIFLNF